MSYLNQYLENKLNEAKNHFQKKDFKGIINIYGEVINKVDNISAFHDFFGETFMIDPNYFMEKFLDTYHRNITKLLDLQQVFDMEANILQKYSLYENEKITASFQGEVQIGGDKMVGRIYLTSFRLILIGTSWGKGVSMVTKSLVGIVIAKSIQKSIVRNLQAKLDEFTDVNLPCLGHQYPMFGVQKIKLGKASVTYKVLLESTYDSGTIKKNKYLLRVLPHGKNRGELAKLVHDTIIEADKNFS